MSVKIPSVLSIQRGTIVTDGAMFSVDQDGRQTPVRVIRHGFRGTLPKEKEDSVSNIQRTESAKTSPTATGLAVKFAYRTISASELIFSCSDLAYREKLDGFIQKFFKEGVAEFDEVCLRFARNILNGRWLWRNRILGEVKVTARCDDKSYKSDGSQIRSFENYTEDEKALAKDVIAAGLLGCQKAAEVEGVVSFGFTGEVEVFPSQNMVTSKPSGFARSLYKMDVISRSDLFAIISTSHKDGKDSGEFAADMIDMGRAALRDQKIGNAIRTIDTWYPGSGSDADAIPIEPNGASLEQNTLHRAEKKSGAKGLLTLIDEMSPGITFNPDAAFLIALLIRGGVFSEKQ